MRKTISIILALCLALAMLPFGVFAASSATLDIALTDESGNAIDTVYAGESVWAEISLGDYELLIGDANYDSGIIDRAIASVYAYLIVDSRFSIAEENGELVCELPYAAIAENGGSLAYSIDGDILRLMLDTDDMAGMAYAIDKAALDAANGVLMRIKLNVAADARGQLNVAIGDGDLSGSTSIALISKTDSASIPTASELALSGIGSYAAVNAVKPPIGTVNLSTTLLKGFKVADWTKVSGNSLTFKDYGELTDCISADSTDGESVYTAGNFNLGNEFHLTYSGYMYYSNQQTYSHHAISIGDLTIDANRSKGTTSNSGHVVVVVSKGGVELARSADLTLDSSSKHTSGYNSTNPSTILYNTYINGRAHGGWFKADYVDGNLTVTVNDKVMVTTAVEGLDLSNAEVKLAAGAGAQGLSLFGLELEAPTVIDLDELNDDLAKLGSITDYSTYSDIAALADIALPLATEAQLAEMTNIPVYEQYKLKQPYGSVSISKDLVTDFKAEDWKHSKGTALTFADYGEVTNALRANFGNPGNYGVYSAGNFNLGNEFHIGFSAFMSWNNYTDYSHHAVSVGDLTVRFDRTTAYNANSGRFTAIVTKDGTEIAMSNTGIAMATNNSTSTNEAVIRHYNNIGTADSQRGGRFLIDYKDGVLSVTVNDAVVVATAVENLDLSNAEVKFSAGAGWQTSTLFDFVLSAPVAIGLYDLNSDMATLADVTDFSTYSDIAATADEVLPLATEEQLANLSNIAVYEQYKLDYAEANKACEHTNTELRDYVDATCTAAGYSGDTYCVDCGEKLANGEIVNALGHTEEVIPGKAATCIETGLTDGVKCSVCEVILTEQVEIPVTDHVYGDWVVDGLNGVQTKTCGTCGDTVTEPYDAADDEVIASGDWNEDGSITWSLTGGGVLTLSGTGDAQGYAAGKNPVFDYRDQVKKLVIGDGITSLGSRAFRGMTGLTEVTFGKDMVSVSYEVFYSCLNLKTVNINEGFKDFGSLAFYNTAIEAIELPSTLEDIQNRVFKNCKNLTYISIPDSVTHMGYEVFMGCTSLTGAKWSANVSYINSMMFNGCTSLTELEVPGTIWDVRSNAFTNSGLKTITITSPNCTFRSDSFNGCDGLTIKGVVGSKVHTYAKRNGFTFEAK